jgi:hypothetical protein
MGRGLSYMGMGRGLSIAQLLCRLCPGDDGAVPGSEYAPIYAPILFARENGSSKSS